MTTYLRAFRKVAIDRRRIYLDYSCWLADDETLTDFQSEVTPYTADAPVQVDSSYPDAGHKRLMTFISGGIANTTYTVSMTIRTSAGQIRRDDFMLRVIP